MYPFQGGGAAWLPTYYEREYQGHFGKSRFILLISGAGAGESARDGKEQEIYQKVLGSIHHGQRSQNERLRNRPGGAYDRIPAGPLEDLPHLGFQAAVFAAGGRIQNRGARKIRLRTKRHREGKPGF